MRHHHTPKMPHYRYNCELGWCNREQMSSLKNCWFEVIFVTVSRNVHTPICIWKQGLRFLILSCVSFINNKENWPLGQWLLSYLEITYIFVLIVGYRVLYKHSSQQTFGRDLTINGDARIDIHNPFMLYHCNAFSNSACQYICADRFGTWQNHASCLINMQEAYLTWYHIHLGNIWAISKCSFRLFNHPRLEW